MAVINSILKNVSSDPDGRIVSMMRKNNYLVIEYNETYNSNNIDKLTITFENGYSGSINGEYDLTHLLSTSIDNSIKINISEYTRNIIKDYLNEKSISERAYPIYSRIENFKITLKADYDTDTQTDTLDYILNPSRDKDTDLSIYNQENYNYNQFYYHADYPCYLTFQFSDSTNSVNDYVIVETNENVYPYSPNIDNSVFGTGTNQWGNINNYDINSMRNSVIEGHYLQNGTDYNNNLFDSVEDYPIFENREGKYIHLDSSNLLDPDYLLSFTGEYTVIKHNTKIIFDGEGNSKIWEWGVGGGSLNINTVNNLNYGLWIDGETGSEYITTEPFELGKLYFLTVTWESNYGKLKIYLNGNKIYDKKPLTSLIPVNKYKQVYNPYTYINADVYALNTTFDYSNIGSSAAGNVINLIDLVDGDFTLRHPQSNRLFNIKPIIQLHKNKNCNKLVKWLGIDGQIKTYLFNTYEKIGTNSKVFFKEDYHIENYSYSVGNYYDFSIDKFSEFKDREDTTEINCNLNRKEYSFVNDIIYSPYIWLWNGHEFAPNIIENWDQVTLDTKSIEINSKKNSIEFNLKFKHND